MQKRLLISIAFLMVLTAICSSIVTYAVLQMSARVSNVAIVKTDGISIYSDQTLTQPLTQIDRGMLELGQNKNFTGLLEEQKNIKFSKC